MNRPEPAWWEVVPGDRFPPWLVELGTLRCASAERQRRRLPALIRLARSWGAEPLSFAEDSLPGCRRPQTAEPPEADSPLEDQWAWLHAVLAHPERRLVVYGTLAPGRCNHWVVEHIPGRWRPATIRGHLHWSGIIPFLSWAPNKPRLDVQVFCSARLPEHWEEIDSFEGGAYCRVLIPAWIGERCWPCYVYHARASWPPPGLNSKASDQV